MKIIGKALAIACLTLILHSQLQAQQTLSRQTQDHPAQHPAVQAFLEPISDPIQGFNRPVESLNGTLVRYIVYPLGLAYNTVIPTCVKIGIANVAHNLIYPLRLVTNLLQGKGSEAWEETERFAINTTAGILGWNDQAKTWGFQRHDEDFGQTLAVWGVGPGFYVNLPFVGPSNLRDTITLIPDMLLMPHTYIPGAGIVIQGNSLFANAAFLKNFFEASQATYHVSRAAYTLARENMVRDAKYEPATSEPDQTLGIMKMMPKDDFFYARRKERRIRLTGAPKDLPFTLYEQKKPDGRLMFVLPGLSSTRNNEDITAMAELYHRDGWTVAVISSTFTPEFFTATNTPLPGLLNRDAPNLDEALTRIRDKIFTETYDDFPHLKPRVAVFGVSLGAINTLLLAARDTRGLSNLNATAFIAVNPPRDPLAALQRLDQCFDVPYQWPPQQQVERARNALRKITGAMLFPGSYPLPQIDFLESRFLIGINCRLGLMEVIRAIADSPAKDALKDVIRTDEPQHLELDALNLSYAQYLQKILLPYAQKHGLVKTRATLPQLQDEAKLDAIAMHLAPNPKIRLFHTRNDFLITPDDLAWYQKILPQRCFIFPAGGHLGQLPDPRVQKALLKAAH